MWRDEVEQTPYQISTNLEVMLVNGQSFATPMTSPTVENLNVIESSRIHIGPNFVSVTQNLQTTEVIKGRFLGLELVSSKQTYRLQCSVVNFFVGWVLIAVTVLAVYITYLALPAPMRLDIGLNESWYLRRDDWHARDPNGTDYLRLPVPYVVIRHTAANYCDQQSICMEQMRIIQSNHLRWGFPDIGSNFFISGNGLVFEGRGANVRAEMIRPWDDKSISIAFMGNYRSDRTRQEQFDNMKVILDVLVNNGVLIPDYMLLAHCQVQPDTYSPGLNILLTLINYPQWNSQNFFYCI